MKLARTVFEVVVAVAVIGFLIAMYEGATGNEVPTAFKYLVGLAIIAVGEFQLGVPFKGLLKKVFSKRK